MARSRSRERRRSRDRYRRSRSRSRDRYHHHRDRSHDRNDRRGRSRSRERSRDRRGHRDDHGRRKDDRDGKHVSNESSRSSQSMHLEAPAKPSEPTIMIQTPSLPPIGVVGERRIIIEKIPKDRTREEVMSYLSSLISAHLDSLIKQLGSDASSDEPGTVCVSSVLSVQFLSLREGLRTAMVDLRTPVAAALLIECNGSVWDGQEISMRRPKDYMGGEPSLTAADLTGDGSLQVSVSEPDNTEERIATYERIVESNPLFHSPQGYSTRVSFSGFPVAMSDEFVHDFLRQFGRTTHFHVLNGAGIVAYQNVCDACACETILNGFPVGKSKIRIERIPEETPKTELMELTQDSSEPAPVQNQPTVQQQVMALTDTTTPPVQYTSISERLKSNPVLAAQLKASREIGARPSSVVQLLNVVYPEDLTEDSEYLQICDAVKAEALKFGVIEQLRIPRPNRDMSLPSGCGKIFVHFRDLLSARKFQYAINGRLFDDTRVVCAAFYPIDRFLQGKFTLYGT